MPLENLQIHSYFPRRVMSKSIQGQSMLHLRNQRAQLNRMQNPPTTPRQFTTRRQRRKENNIAKRTRQSPGRKKSKYIVTQAKWVFILAPDSKQRKLCELQLRWPFTKSWKRQEEVLDCRAIPWTPPTPMPNRNHWGLRHFQIYPLL